MSHGSGEHAIELPRHDTQPCPPWFEEDGNEPETMRSIPAMVMLEDETLGGGSG